MSAMIRFECNNRACDGYLERFEGRCLVSSDGQPDGRPVVTPFLVSDGLCADCCPLCGEPGECAEDESALRAIEREEDF